MDSGVIFTFRPPLDVGYDTYFYANLCPGPTDCIPMTDKDYIQKSLFIWSSKENYEIMK